MFGTAIHSLGVDPEKEFQSLNDDSYIRGMTNGKDVIAQIQIDKAIEAERGRHNTQFLPRNCEPCCYLVEDPGATRLRYCDVPSLPGKSYCPGHHSLTHRQSKRS